MAPFFLEILDFQFLHVFPRYFNNFAIGLFVCKCALVSFYTYFLRILTILQISFIFQTPPRPPPDPPRDPLGPPWDPPRTLSDQGRRSGSIQLVQTRQVLTMFVRSSGSIQRSDSSMDYKHSTKHKQSSWQRSGPAECAERLNKIIYIIICN